MYSIGGKSKVIYNPQVTFCGFTCRKINKIQNTAKLRKVITVVLVFTDSVITSVALRLITLCTSPWLDHSIYRCAVKKIHQAVNSCSFISIVQEFDFLFKIGHFVQVGAYIRYACFWKCEF